MGAVYTLGPQPGTVVRNNRIHDVTSFTYGGWGLYTDEGSSGIVLESNVVYRCKSAGFHQHYGRENVVRNNIFAFNKESQLMRSREETHTSFYCSNNIVLFNSGKLLDGTWKNDRFVLDGNLYWDTRVDGDTARMKFNNVSLEQWRARGHDVRSVFADPLFVNAAANDFRLQSNSPAFQLGFEPIDLAQTTTKADWATPGRDSASMNHPRPDRFPHRIWAACDFEGLTPDYGWFGRPETNDILRYPGNVTALSAAPGPYQNFSAVMAGINPVPGPRMGKVNRLFVRYHLTGGSEATFQHFSLTREDNWHIRVDGLEPGRWAQATLDFTRDARRNDGSSEPFVEGERMDDFKVFAGLPAEAARYRLLIDDVIFFANDPALPEEPEPFPNRVILLAAFDTGPKEKYWPGDFELIEQPPPGAYWRAARAVKRRNGNEKLIRLAIEPPRQLGARTKLRFRYHLTGDDGMTVQIFDATVQDNRHVVLRELKQGSWTTCYVDLSRDARRNDGTANSPFAAGHKVDDLFFFLRSEAKPDAELFVDEVVLYDAGSE
jgi:parallel beta-helix repeat protein